MHTLDLAVSSCYYYWILLVVRGGRRRRGGWKRRRRRRGGVEVTRVRCTGIAAGRAGVRDPVLQSHEGCVGVGMGGVGMRLKSDIN
jgi:hypothetical protein